MENLNIRLEEKKDWLEAEVITRAAFWRQDRISDIGIGAVEHYMLHAMRGNDGIKDLTFVAEINGKIVGHVIFTKNSYILQANGNKKDVLNFGPLSVLPEYQKQGIGTALMQHAIKKARELNYGAIIFFGHITYYPRFGFVPAEEFHITTSFGDYSPSLMGMELKKGYLDGVSGKFIEADIYDEDITKDPAKDFDKNFLR